MSDYATDRATPNTDPDDDAVEILPLVLADMQARYAYGLEKYGVSLRANNNVDGLKEAYQETLDKACYLRLELYRRDGR